MNTRTRTVATLLSVVALSALPWSQAVQAGSGLQRCQSADGSISYTDRGCAVLGSKPMPVPAELLTRIASERSREEQTAELDAFPEIAETNYTPGRRSPLGGCARSKQQLLADLRGAFALGNVNRLAESYHWVGKSNRQAQQQMLQLERMAGEGLLEAQLFDTQIGLGAGDGSAAMLQLTLGQDQPRQVLDLDVMRYSGCYFARI